jgi:hypothetical protein
LEEWEKVYQEAVNSARATALNRNGVPKAATEQLYLLYAQMLRDIDRDFGSGFISESRKDGLKNQILARLDQLSAQLSRTFAIQERNAIEQAIRGHQDGLNAVSSMGYTVGANFTQIPETTVDFMLQRRGIFGSKNYQTLIGRNLQSMGGQVDRFLNSAISRGVSAERASQELAGMIARNDQRLLGLIDNGRLRKSAIRSALRNSEIDKNTFKMARKVLYDAKRIMVTEINTAYREADILSSYESPVVGAKRWRVSARHFGLPSTPDVCTMYYETDLFGMGEGVFPVLNTPSTPHPFCGCLQTDVLRPVNEWNNPKPDTIEPKRITADQVRKKLAQSKNKSVRAGLEKATDNHIKKQVEIANEYAELAYRWSKRVKKSVTG